MFQIAIYFSIFCVVFLCIATYLGPDNEQLEIRHRREIIERKPTFLELIKRNVIRKCEQIEHNHDHKPTFIELIKKSSVRECDKNEGIQTGNYIQRLENLYYESFPSRIGDNDEDDIDRNLKEVNKRKFQISRYNRNKRNIFNPSHLNPAEVDFQSMEDKNRLRRQAQKELVSLQSQYTKCKRFTPDNDCDEIYDKFATLANEINMKFSEMTSILQKMDKTRDSDEEQKQLEVLKKYNKKKGKKISEESDEYPLPTLHNHVIRLKPNQTKTLEPEDPIEGSTTETSVAKDETIGTTTETSVTNDEILETTTETSVLNNEIFASTTETSVAKDDLVTTTETSVAKDDTNSTKADRKSNSNDFFATPKIHEDLNNEDLNKKWYSDIKTQHMTMEQFIKSKTGHISRNSEPNSDSKKSDRAEQNNAQVTTNSNPKDSIKFLCKIFCVLKIIWV